MEYQTRHLCPECERVLLQEDEDCPCCDDQTIIMIQDTVMEQLFIILEKHNLLDEVGQSRFMNVLEALDYYRRNPPDDFARNPESELDAVMKLPKEEKQ